MRIENTYAQLVYYIYIYVVECIKKERGKEGKKKQLRDKRRQPNAKREPEWMGKRTIRSGNSIVFVA